MNWHRVRRYACFVLVGFTLVAVIFAEWSVSAGAPGWLRMVSFEIQAACRDAGTQWMVVVCLVSYLVAFVVLKKRLAQRSSEPTVRSPESTVHPPSGDFGAARSPKSRVLSGGKGPEVFAPSVLFCGGNPDTWLVGFVGLVLLRYAVSYETALQPLVLLAGLVFGKGIALWAAWPSSSKFQVPSSELDAERGREARRRLTWLLFVICALLGAAALWQPEMGMEFRYRGLRRWAGAWGNPNTYGLLMGTGLTLAVGLFVQRLNSRDPVGKGQGGDLMGTVIRRATFPLLLVVGGLCGFGLLKSYSRGAWLGTACAFVYLAWGRSSPRLRHVGIPLLLLLISTSVLAFWQLRHSEIPLVRRAFSVGNVNDFSWRNRVTVWNGSIRMMTDHPWFGVGWGQVDKVFAESYRAPRLEETMAVQLNDYFTLGAAVGVPALLCFVVFIGLSLRRALGVLNGHRPQQLKRPAPLPDHRPTATTGLAVAILLLIGFWFDGGLFKLPTAALFWVVLELGRVAGTVPALASHLTSATQRVIAGSSGEEIPGNRSRAETGLRWLAGIVALLAVGQSAFQLLTPRFGITPSTLELARNHLVQPTEQQDFGFLSTNTFWAGKRLRTLLEHVELAHYNRGLVNWKLDDDIFRRYVLSSQIDPARDGDMSWRRPLWESFYPRIRKEYSLEAAAEIIVRHLRERVTIVPGEQPVTSIAEIWTKQITDAGGFEAIYVAALRSAGVPARLNPIGQAELFTGTEWKPAPTPAL